jgi:hypothetical protein
MPKMASPRLAGLVKGRGASAAFCQGPGLPGYPSGFAERGGDPGPFAGTREDDRSSRLGAGTPAAVRDDGTGARPGAHPVSDPVAVERQRRDRSAP